MGIDDIAFLTQPHANAAVSPSEAGRMSSQTIERQAAGAAVSHNQPILRINRSPTLKSANSLRSCGFACPLTACTAVSHTANTKTKVIAGHTLRLPFPWRTLFCNRFAR